MADGGLELLLFSAGQQREKSKQQRLMYQRDRLSTHDQLVARVGDRNESHPEGYYGHEYSRLLVPVQIS